MYDRIRVKAMSWQKYSSLVPLELFQSDLRSSTKSVDITPVKYPRVFEKDAVGFVATNSRGSDPH